MSVLLDANLLIALTVEDHVHHGPAEAWFSTLDETFATNPITEGSLVRHFVRRGQAPATARDVIAALSQHPRYEFWPADVSYRYASLDMVMGHRQVTDAYLVHLARSRDGRLATFDRPLADLYLDAVELVPTG